jgi:hypothetical protein
MLLTLSAYSIGSSHKMMGNADDFESALHSAELARVQHNHQVPSLFAPQQASNRQQQHDSSSIRLAV